MRIRDLPTYVRVFCLSVIVAFFWSAGDVRAHVGTGIDLDREGRIYFTDTYHNCIWRMETNGTLTKVIEGVHLDYLVVADDGYVYLIKDGVWRIGPQGELTELLNFTQFLPDAGRLLCIDRQANIYFVTSTPSLPTVPEIHQRTQDGKVTLIATGLFGGVKRGEGNIYVHPNLGACPGFASSNAHSRRAGCRIDFGIWVRNMTPKDSAR